MDEAARELAERTHRSHLFEDCTICGEPSVRIGNHVCDPVRRETYQAALIPVYEPNEWVVEDLERKLLDVLTKHRIIVNSAQLRDMALAVEPVTRGPIA